MSPYILGKLISVGWSGACYNIKIENDPLDYALRRTKINNNNAKILKNINSNDLSNLLDNPINMLIRFIYVGIIMYNINKNHFLHIIDFKMIKNAKYMIPFDNGNKNNDNYIKDHNKMNSYKYCFDIITDLKDGSFNEIYKKLNKKQFLSAMIQIINMHYI